MRRIVLVAHNLRSCHNVGSLLRTCDGLGVETVYLTGYTPYPMTPCDMRLPYVARKVAARIHKTALGAESMVSWERHDDVEDVFTSLRARGFEIAALEQRRTATKLPDFQASEKVALVVGSEVEGLESDILVDVDQVLEISMLGSKESFNVVQAAAMALYQIRWLAG